MRLRAQREHRYRRCQVSFSITSPRIDSIGTASDKRTALQIHSRDLWSQQRPVVDGLTKKEVNLDPLYGLLKGGRINLISNKNLVEP